MERLSTVQRQTMFCYFGISVDVSIGVVRLLQVRQNYIMLLCSASDIRGHHLSRHRHCFLLF